MKEKIIDYYNICWLTRFESGHNPESLAMHLGFFDNDIIDNDFAKIRTNELIFQIINKKSAEKLFIVDLGCGVGGSCFYLANAFFNSAIYGVNISKTQVGFAKNKKEQKNLSDQICFLEKDFSETGLASDISDVVIGIESICHAVNKRKVFKEAYRLLKNGGQLILFDYFESRAVNNDYEKKLLNTFRSGWAVNQYLTDEVEVLSKVGFKSVQSKVVTEQVVPGMNKSYEKAENLLLSEEFENTEIFKHHLEACVALKGLVEIGIIDYKIVVAIK